MKLRFAAWGIFLALCVTPALADSLHFSNDGLISGSGSDNGINAVSVLTQMSFGNSILLWGNLGAISFDTGSFVGSLIGGGSFSDGTFDLSFNALGRFCPRAISPGLGPRCRTIFTSSSELFPPWCVAAM